MTNEPLRGGMTVRVLSPYDAKMRTPGAGKRYRLERDGKALFALRDESGAIRNRFLGAELERWRASGRLVVDEPANA